MRLTPTEPKLILFQGEAFKLHTPYQQHPENDAISIGPFYSRDGVEPLDWMYQPDTEFLNADDPPDQPSMMHLIQQRSPPETPRPEPLL
jgi:hypothetical protein